MPIFAELIKDTRYKFLFFEGGDKSLEITEFWFQDDLVPLCEVEDETGPTGLDYDYWRPYELNLVVSNDEKEIAISYYQRKLSIGDAEYDGYLIRDKDGQYNIIAFMDPNNTVECDMYFLV